MNLDFNTGSCYAPLHISALCEDFDDTVKLLSTPNLFSLRFAALFSALLAVLSCAPVALHAQVPALISNQGRLHDGQQMIDGDVTLVLRVYTNATEGTFLYEDISQVEVVDGYYSAFLGDDTTFGSLQEALSQGEAYIEVSVDGVVFPPRELISSVAYSFRAGESDGLTVGALTSDMIGEDVIRDEHLAARSVTSRSLGKGSVTEGHLADDAVTTDKLGPGVRAKIERAVKAAEESGAGARTRAQALRVEPSAESPNLVAGHMANHADAGSSGGVVGGGGKANEPNEVQASFATVAGGANNSARGEHSTIAGGWSNRADGKRATIAGGRLNRAPGSTAVVGGGYNNSADGNYATLSGGYGNQATGYVATVGGGWSNQASGPVSAVGGGQENRASGAASQIGGGWNNRAEAFASVVAGGNENRASGAFSAIGGGSNNVTSGEFSMVPGGRMNEAAGRGSMAAGSQARAAHDGTFVWADSQVQDFSSTGPDQVLIRARGNVGIDTDRPLEKLTVRGNIAPADDGAYELGTEARRWRNVHLVDGLDASDNFSVTSAGSTNLTVTTNGVVWVPGTLVAEQIVGDGSGLTGVVSSLLSDEIVVDRMIHPDASIAPGKVAGVALTMGTDFGGDVQGRYDNLVLQPGVVDERALADEAVSARTIANGTVGLEKLTPTALAELQNQTQRDGWSLQGNELDGSDASPFLGSRNAQPVEFRVDNRAALRIEPTTSSPNLVAGHEGNSVAGSVLGATISGGGDTDAMHRVTGSYGTIGGGLGNNVGNEYATVAGGINNTAAGSAATVAGGWKNAANDLDATVGGGQDNVAGGSASTVAGGFNNQALGNYSAVPGGINNQAQGDYAMAAGRDAHAMHDGSFVWSDSSDESFSSTASDQYLIQASGNVGIDTVSPSEKLTVSGNVAPAQSDRFSLGSSALRWREVYLSIVEFGEQASFVSGGEPLMSLDREGHLTAAGTVRASSFVGDGSGLSGISGSALTQGSITDGQISQLAAIDPRKVDGIALTEGSRFSGDVQGTPKSLMLQDGAVRGAKLADGSVTSAKIRQNSVGAEHLTDELRSSFGKKPATWEYGGNRGTKAERDFLGTADREPFQIHVANARAMRLEPTADGPNIILGAGRNQAMRGTVSAVISGGGSLDTPNLVRGSYGTIGGGVGNEAGDEYATVSGGFGNRAKGFDTTIGGGQDNEAAGSGSTISGGFTNRASGPFSTIGGGADNQAAGNVAVVSGGFGNRANGAYATVVGGTQNEAAADYTQASGRRAKARHPGAWVWSDSKDADFVSTRNDQFLIRAAGGVGLGMNRPQYLLHLAGGAYSDGMVWANASDENLKEDFASVRTEEILQRLAGLPVYSWQYKADETDARHLGPTAQDFRAAFGLGGNDVSISTVDAQGVAFAAIQALARENAELKNSNAMLHRRLEAIERRLGVDGGR